MEEQSKPSSTTIPSNSIRYSGTTIHPKLNKKIKIGAHHPYLCKRGNLCKNKYDYFSHGRGYRDVSGIGHVHCFYCSIPQPSFGIFC